jgi:hypothetical protein
MVLPEFEGNGKNRDILTEWSLKPDVSERNTGETN